MARKRRTTAQRKIVYSVSELTAVLRDYFEKEHGAICVQGEVSGYKISHSGHAYFALKDEAALLNCVMWRSTVSRMPDDLVDGMLIQASGGLSLYPPRGAYQLVVRSIRLAGVGDLLKRFEILKQKLFDEGLFDESHKIPIPPLPQRVAVITSPTGAAIRDFLKVLGPVASQLEIDVYPVHVQGIEACGEICHALETLDALGKHDILILTRGGGSLEDLWCFNEEALARAIYSCKTPVISAVGHEIDTSISDLVADLRLPTPTAAGLFLAQSRENLHRRFLEAYTRLADKAIMLLEHRRQQMDNYRATLRRLSPRAKIDIERQRLSDAIERLVMLTGSAIERRATALDGKKINLMRQPVSLLQIRQERLQSLAKRLVAISPKATLARGYSLTALEDTLDIIKDSRQLDIGNRIRTRFARGEASSEILGVKS